jgi:hypothetical protein
LQKCVGRLQDENDKLREALSWLSSQEPQLGMMIASCKGFDGWALGLDKVGEGSEESNGSQREQISENLVDDEEPPSISILRMGTSEVMPRDIQVQAPVVTNTQDPPS